MTEPVLTEPTPAPEVFVDGFASTSAQNGVVKFTFFSISHNPADGSHEQRIVLRLATPLASVVGMHEAMGRFLTRVDSHLKTVKDVGASLNDFDQAAHRAQ